MTRQSEMDDPGGKPDLLTWMLLWSTGVVTIGLAFVSQNCLLQVDMC